ncbi:unnamed protein product [Adineta steineri]|uniref:Uncharacterized protein n=1 Tax=Adineta steineri TaxID=433720 RepID=A0A819WH98_9BILA|nr:unnamed protein product [Adineta steineri]CAF4124463.1 unnamed protein product [Adineta steineri]
MDVKLQKRYAEEIILHLPKFGGSHYEDVTQWLHDTEELFEQAQLRPSNKFIVAQCYLTATAEKWFRIERSTIHDWVTFKIEIVKAFPPLFNPILLKGEQCRQLSHVTTSSTISLTSTIPEKKQNTEHDLLAPLNDNQIEPFEDFADENLNEYSQEHFSLILVPINDIDLEIQSQCTDVLTDFDTLNPPYASVSGNDPMKHGVEDAIEVFTAVICTAITDDSLTNTIVSQDVQYLCPDQYQFDEPTSKIVQSYTSNIFYPDLLDKTRPYSCSLIVYEDIALKLSNLEWNCSSRRGFRYICHNGIFQNEEYDAEVVVLDMEMVGTPEVRGSEVPVHGHMTIEVDVQTGTMVLREAVMKTTAKHYQITQTTVKKLIKQGTIHREL